MSVLGRTTHLVIAVLLLVGSGAVEACAQEQGEEQGQEGAGSLEGRAAETELVFRREVFTYPQFQRRNPFRVLVGQGNEPRYEQMSVQGIIFSPSDPSASMVLMRGAAGQQGGPAQSRRVRVGEAWGNVRVLEIRRDEVLVEVEEFGVLEQRIMRLPTRAQGGS